MRKILFRGKVVDEPNEWVYGDYITPNKIRQYIDKGTGHCGVGIFEVIPETVCQYIGRNDDIGRKIFENDYLINYEDDNRIIKIQIDDDSASGVVDENVFYDLSSFSLSGFTVVGNIFDNSEYDYYIPLEEEEQ